MESVQNNKMTSLKKNKIFLFAQEEIRSVPQIDWFLIIELYHLISKNHERNCVLFFNINI